jgi:ribosomal protein L7Ae-like RNA K-turn-binding protein
VAIGVGAARAALQRGEARVGILASDASARTLEKVERLASGSGVPVLRGPMAEAIGARLGRPPVMAVAVRDRDLAAGILANAARDGA